MMGIGSLARCCCNCEDCCNGSYPSEFDVDIALTDDKCTICNELYTGTFTLGHTTTPPGGSVATCSWAYSHTYGFFTDICRPAGPYDPFSAWYLRFMWLRLRVTCVNATQYSVTLQMVLSAFDNATARSVDNLYQWGEYVDVTDWPCDGVVDWCLPFQFRSWGTSGSGNGPWYSEGAYPPGEIWLCNPTGSTACVTAIP